MLVVALLASAPQPTPTAQLPIQPRPQATKATRTTVPRPQLVHPKVDPRQASLDERARELGLERRPVGDGYAYRGEPHERFDAIVHDDGTVEFEIDPSVQVTLDGVCVFAVCAQPQRTRNPSPRTRRHRSRAARGALTAATLLAEIALGRVGGTRTYGQPTQGPLYQPENPPPFLAGAVQGRYGILPAPTSSMTEFLDRTLELRAELAAIEQRRRLQESRKHLPEELIRLWAQDLPAKERRQLLLQRWAELETPDLPDDPILRQEVERSTGEARRDATDHARKVILRFVRRHAPQGSPDAFTPAELEAFNARADVHVVFAPYGS
jgi:hypothetical protein